MKKQTLIGALSLMTILGLSLNLSSSNNSGEKLMNNGDEKELIVGDEPFDKMMAVLLHKRCVNCHPAGNIPLQGEDSHLHNFDIARGTDGHGLSAYTCETCHTDENNDFSGVPGAPHWALAPSHMAWEGKTRVEVATQMMNQSLNGGRTPEEIEKHLTEHELVLWAWNPGVDAEGVTRELPPVPKEAYIQAVKDWIKNGAIIPTE